MVRIGSNDIPEWKAAIFLSFWLSFYISISISVPRMLGLMKEPKVSHFFTIGAFMLVLIMNYYLFIKNKKYLKIGHEFETTHKFSNVKGTIIMFIFLIVPFLELMYVLFIKFVLKPH